jgi:hypothetical protein
MLPSVYSGSCPRCGQRYNFRSQSVGLIRRCQRCGFKFETPAPPFAAGCLILAVLLGIGYLFTGGRGNDKTSRVVTRIDPPAAPVQQARQVVPIQAESGHVSVDQASAVDVKKQQEEAVRAGLEKKRQQEEQRQRELTEQDAARAAEQEARRRAIVEAEAFRRDIAKQEADATRKLKLAKSFIPENLVAARRRLTEIATDYPDTPAGKEAKLLLEKLGK